MDKIYTDPNMENDNTEHIRGKRLSSILKAPRNPLDDLGNGNELTQDVEIEKRRKSSRRVSFANTINCRVFQRDLKNSTSETENTECAAEEKKDVFTDQNGDPEAVPCEITGMNTLLHAPIQALVQQTEWHDVDHAAPRTGRQDTTLLFSGDNEMDMTASHTAMISGDFRAHQPDITEKIDITSFLAGLNSSQGKAETSKEFGLFSDPTNRPCPSLEQNEEGTTVKKINFNEFLLSLKSNNKAPSPAEGPDKENVCCVPFQGSGDVAQPSRESGCSHEPLDTCNVTKVFRGQEGGMEMTKCEAAGVKILFPGIGEAPLEQWERADVTEAFADEGMDMTTSHTAKVTFPLSAVGNQSLNCQKDFPPTESDDSVLRRTSKENLGVQQDPQLCADKKPASAEDRGGPPVLRAGKQEARAVPAIRGSVSSETVFRGDRTVVFSKCGDMEMTGNYTDIIYNDSSTEMNSLCHKTCEKLGSTNPLLAGSRHPVRGDRDIPKGLAPGESPAAVSYKTSALELPSASGGHMENVSQARGPAAASAGFDSSTNLVAQGVPKSRFHPSATPQLVSSGEKTVMFPGEDMDLTKTCVKDDGKNVDNESPGAVFTSVTCKPHFLGNRSMSSNVTDQEEMEITKCHPVVIDDQSSGITAELKQMPCKIIPRKNQDKSVIEDAYSTEMDKENIEVWSIRGNIKRSQAMERNARDLQMVMVDKKLGKTDFQASDLSSCAKSMCLLQEQSRGVPENVVTNSAASLPLQSQKVVVSQPLEKNLPNISVSCANDTAGVFSGDQSMDITKAHPAAFDIAPINTEESNNNNNQNTAMSNQLQNQPFPFSSSFAMDSMSQTAAMGRGDLKMNTNKQIVTPLAPSQSSFTHSNKPAPSGMRGNEQPGTVLGINADCQNSERQEKPQPVRAVNKVLPIRGEPERHFSIGKTGSSREDLKTPPSADGLLQGAVEEPVQARMSEPPKGSSQLCLFGEKSVVFPHGENMDMTGNCVLMVPDYSINVDLPQSKAAPGCFGPGGNELISLEKGTMMTTNNQEQPMGQVNSSVLGREMLPTSGVKHFADEQTTLFSGDADMDITRSHTVSAENRVILQSRISNGAPAMIPRDQTCVFLCDMEITKLDTSAAHKSVGKAASQGFLSTARRTGRKSLKGTPGEKTVLFSLSDENDDMEMTQSHTAAIGQEIVQDEGELRSLSSAHPVRSVMFQADVDISKSCSADKTTGQVVGDGKPNSGKEAGLPNSQVTMFAEDDMEISKPLHAALAQTPLQGQQPSQPVPSTSTVLFSSYQAAMEMTEAHSVDANIGRGFCEDRGVLPEQGGQGAAAGGGTVGIAPAQDVEITTTHTAQPIPADKTIVFAQSQEDMEFTASHTVAVNKHVGGFEAQQVSHTDTQQPPERACGTSVSCRGEMDSSHTRDPSSEYPTKPKDKPSIPSSVSSASFSSEKGGANTPSGTTPDSVFSVSLPENTMDVWAPRDHDLPTDNSVPVSREQGLLPPENLQSKGVSFKFPSNGPVDGREESGNLGSGVTFPIQGSDHLEGSPDGHSSWRKQGVEEDSAPDLGLAGASLIPAANKESKENEELSAEGETPPKDLEINSEQTKQPLGSDSPRDQAQPTLPPALSGILDVCSKLKDLRRKSLSVSKTAFSDQLPKSSAQPEDTLRLGKSTVSEANNLPDTKEQENTGLESGAAPTGMALMDKYPGINIPLGIFQPKLPNRRNPSFSSVPDTKPKSDRAEVPAPANTSETPGNKSSRQNFSPSQFIAEEFLPVCLEEMDSNESDSFELVEKAWDERNKNQIPHYGKGPIKEGKTCNAKRALEGEEEDLESPKKIKRDENVDAEASRDLKDQVGVDEGGEPPNLSSKSPECPHASTSSSLDSVKADTELTIQPSSQVESQLLTDSICEENLWEKFQSGAVTVGEFFTLLQVHVVIQKPRHSHLPANCAVSTPPTAEDLIYSQYVHRPKLRIYEEDCQDLSQKIDELKPYANVQDQLLVNVNRSLWEVMRTCTDEELRNFGAELNKMKSYFTKETKILGHNEKETLYRKLLQSAQEQHRKLQSRIEKVDDLLKEAESCLVALESDSFWDEGEADCRDGTAGGQNLQKELESLKAQEEELQRELSEMETEDEQMVGQMDELKETEKRCQELLEKYDFTEWEIMEWSEQQAVFNFLYDSLTLTVAFGPPIDGDDFSEDLSRTIISLNFESFLDEEQAPPSSCLVKRLIFQFIESQGRWQEKCPTLYYLPQVLHDVSLVVNRCKTLGEEMEFLERWGGKFNLKTDIKDTEVKLLFSSSAAFAKFELTLALSASYPSAALPFSVQTHIGNIGEKEIAAVLSSIPVGHHYLRRMVTLIHQNLLQDPR